jgi:hypothetical protein
LERCDDTRLGLGLFHHQKLTKGTQVVYDEKRLFWGAVKWGKRKPTASNAKSPELSPVQADPVIEN